VVTRVDSPTQVQHPIEVVEEKGSKPVAVVAPYDEVAEEESKRPIRRAPGVPGLPRPRRKESDPGGGAGGGSANSNKADGQSVHSYEEIAASEVASETQSQDLSPIYEEIPGGSRSSVSSSSGSGRSLASPRGKFYYAMYDFSPEAGEVTLLRVVRGQAVRVVQVSGEWWYVEDRTSSRGYVPAAYLRPYRAVQAEAISE